MFVCNQLGYPAACGLKGHGCSHKTASSVDFTRFSQILSPSGVTHSNPRATMPPLLLLPIPPNEKEPNLIEVKEHSGHECGVGVAISFQAGGSWAQAIRSRPFLTPRKPRRHKVNILGVTIHKLTEIKSIKNDSKALCFHRSLEGLPNNSPSDSLGARRQPPKRLNLLYNDLEHSLHQFQLSTRLIQRLLPYLARDSGSADCFDPSIWFPLLYDSNRTA